MTVLSLPGPAAGPQARLPHRQPARPPRRDTGVAVADPASVAFACRCRVTPGHDQAGDDRRLRGGDPHAARRAGRRMPTTRAAAAKGWRVFKAANPTRRATPSTCTCCCPPCPASTIGRRCCVDALVKDLAPELLTKYQDAFAGAPSKAQSHRVRQHGGGAAPPQDPRPQSRPQASSPQPSECNIAPDVEALIRREERRCLAAGTRDSRA